MIFYSAGGATSCLPLNFEERENLLQEVSMQKKEKKKQKKKRVPLKKTWMLHVMLLPGNVAMAIFGTLVMIIGVVVSLKKFKPALGFTKSPWCGLDNFKYIFQMPDTFNLFRNTLVIAVGKIILTQVLALLFAVLINEVRSKRFQKGLQTIVYLPHFMSWVILATVIRSIFGNDGSVNMMLVSLGIIDEPISFLGSNVIFQPLMIITEAWKEYGFAAVIFLAALVGIDQGLYEAASIDGASRFQRIIHVTLPGISVTIILVAVLQIANVLNAGFDQIYNLYAPVVYETGDVIDTFVYRMGLLNSQYSIATAIGFTKSIISLFLILTSQYLAKRFANYSIF